MGRSTWLGLGFLVGTVASAAGLPMAAPEKATGGVRFTYSDPNATAVFWSGDFNGWSTTATPMTRADGVWSVVVPLGPGEHQYKFVVDGQYIADPENGATAGEFGNSVIRIGPGGEVLAAKATSNTAYSPKILIGGRAIGMYKAIRDPERDRFELRRPTMDIDLDLDTRISDVLQARFLLNIESEADTLDLFRTNLSFDRGHLLLTRPKFRIFAYDNEAAGTWDDPLHLVGAVGIYDHDYGYGRQGFRLQSTAWGLDSELHYADNFRLNLGTDTAYPGLAASAQDDAIAGLATVPDGSGGFRLAGDATGTVSTIANTDNNEDMVAARVRRGLGDGFTVGLLGRMDRGFNLGSMAAAEATGPASFRTVVGNFEEMWYALGGEVAWKTPWNLELFAEALRGRLQADFVNGTAQTWQVDEADSDGVVTAASLASTDAGNQSLTLDTSHRAKVGGTWRASHGDILFGADLEFEDHAYEVLEPGLDNSMLVGRVRWDRNWRYYLNREVKTGLTVEYHAFDYDPATPWEYQLWFPTGNFWLEHRDQRVHPRNNRVIQVPGYDRVTFDRLTLLGGNDVVSLRPTLEIPLHLARNFVVRYAGRLNAVSFHHRPKYIETILQAGYDLTPSLRLGADTRWAKYSDPVLELHDGYVSHFAELTYRFSPSIQVAFSYGVDPWVLDPYVNEYAYIGRDQFLFDPDGDVDRNGYNGAHGIAAETDFLGLGDRIRSAEKALRDDRRLQVEAVVRF